LEVEAVTAATSPAANTNGVRPEDIQRVYDKLALSLPLFLSTECGREEAMTLIGALLLHAMELHISRFPRARRAESEGCARCGVNNVEFKDGRCRGVPGSTHDWRFTDMKHRANFMRLVGELYDKVEAGR
jgi:hypothetical protein